MKAPKAVKHARPPPRHALRKALVMNMRQKAQAERGVKIVAPEKHTKAVAEGVPIMERAGAPLVSTPVKPQNWVTLGGKPITVDLGRVPWLPDEYGQGVKMTNKISRSRDGFGGTYTVWIAPDGKVFYHKPSVEAYIGRKLTAKDGFNGQMRLARLQGKLTDVNKFFDLLSAVEKKHLPSPDELHFCMISARRAQTAEGVNDIAIVEAHFNAEGVKPTWYVDEESLEEYKKLGLDAVIGGKLTQARNRALSDAARMGRACVQISDDIGAWEYHDGVQAECRSDDATNDAFGKATCHSVGPVSAARFILAKMRAAKDPNGNGPHLGGVYPVHACARAFGGGSISRHHFILGDFFVTENSPIRFDKEMTLKEDYDFTCAHIHRHGSVLRCNRMSVKAKHQTNAGGAVSERDKAGLKEQMNIAILRNKWGRAIKPNPKRKNEVLLRWPADGDLKVTGKAASMLTSDAGVESDASSNGSKQFSTKGSDVKRTAGEKRVIIISKQERGLGPSRNSSRNG